MRFDFYNNFGALNSPPIFSAFEQGLIKLGHTVEKHTGSGDVAVIWSVLWHGKMHRNKEVWENYRSKNLPVIVLEVGGLKRNHTWKVGLNGISRENYFNLKKHDSSRRKQLGLNLKPWNFNGRNILICTQHERSLQWQNNPKTSDWIEQTILKIKQHTDRPIVIRSHPRCPFNFDYKKYSVTKSISKDFYSELRQARTVVTWNSNPGVESIINGIPAIVHDTSLAWPVSVSGFENIETTNLSDREQWFNDLVWTEWTEEEMTQGIPQQYLLDYIQFSKITGSSTDVI
jgi:hypothetical protein